KIIEPQVKQYFLLISQTVTSGGNGVILLVVFMLVIIFPYLPGSSSPAFQGVSVFLGILLSLGSSSATSNMVAGLVITYMRPFKVGDRVKIGEVVGDVTEKTMLVTRIRTIKNEDVTVPNSMVLSSSTVNYSSRTKNNEPGLILHYTVTIGYDIAWKQVYELLTKAALQTNHIEKEPAPFILQTSLDDFYISYQINAYTLQANLQASIYSNLLENIQDIFNEAGIEILSPQYNVIRKEE
ncbi:MAG: mechanosensitive ion channel family protein, partial [Pedobacter sp.]